MLESHLVVMYDSFNVLLNLVCNILLRIFTSMSVKDIGLSLFFFAKVVIFIISKNKL